jgi:hypothetical protein
VFNEGKEDQTRSILPPTGSVSRVQRTWHGMMAAVARVPKLVCAVKLSICPDSSDEFASFGVQFQSTGVAGGLKRSAPLDGNLGA